MKKLFAIFLILALTGCLEDKGALLAQCRLKYETDSSNTGLYSDHTNLFLCMREKGFEFESRAAGMKVLESGKSDWCWTTMPPQPTIPILERPDEAECYHSVGIFKAAFAFIDK